MFDQNKVWASIVLVVLLGAASAAHAQAWPSRRTVTIVVANSPGAVPDTIARMAADALGRSFEQRFIVENKPGGNGFIATMQVVRSKPDGYTLYLAGGAVMAQNPHTLKSIPYDPEKDLTPISLLISSSPLLIVVHPSLPVRTVQDLVKLAREQPGRLNYAAAGTLAPFLGEMLNKSAGINILQVRYKNTPESVSDTVAGRTHVNFLGQTSALPMVQDNRLRLIGIAGRERYSLMPNVAALEEDYPGIAVEGWFALLGPAGFPEEISVRIRQVLDPYLKSPQTTGTLHDLGLSTSGALPQQETRAFIRAQSERWARIMRETGIKPE
jgi:tripartite-type tricarboxylate transporter receptor subunit TctC